MSEAKENLEVISPEEIQARKAKIGSQIIELANGGVELENGGTLAKVVLDNGDVLKAYRDKDGKVDEIALTEFRSKDRHGGNDTTFPTHTSITTSSMGPESEVTRQTSINNEDEGSLGGSRVVKSEVVTEGNLVGQAFGSAEDVIHRGGNNPNVTLSSEQSLAVTNTALDMIQGKVEEVQDGEARIAD